MEMLKTLSSALTYKIQYDLSMKLNFLEPVNIY